MQKCLFIDFLKWDTKEAQLHPIQIVSIPWTLAMCHAHKGNATEVTNWIWLKTFYSDITSYGPYNGHNYHHLPLNSIRRH